MRTIVFLIGLSLAASNFASADEKKSLAEELPRIGAVEPADAVKTFKVLHGFSLEQVAAEPLVADPVDGCFDANGRLYIAEMRDYPFSDEPTRYNPEGGGKKNAGIVRLLEDTNGDGKFDRSIKFADKLRFPTSVCCYDGGVFVLAPPTLHYFKDTDGDDVADVHKIVFEGFGRANVQGLANNMKWTFDNRIALAAGRNPGKLTQDGKEVFTLGGKDLVFDPKTYELEPLTGGIQFGHSTDNYGNRFVCSNSNHIQHIVFPYRYTKRNPYFTASETIRSIAKRGAAAPVFRRSGAEPWRIVRTRRRISDPKMKARLPRTEQFAIGFFTSATGVTVYRGSAYPQQFQGNVFVGDVGGNLVHRKTIAANGASFLADRADEKAEFIASTDNWFRPTNFVNAPDGTLFLLDMYRETIEHPYSIPADIKKHLLLESGDDRGRVYRLRPPNWKQPTTPKLAKASSAELVQQLESGNSWNRETAQRLLVERQDMSSVKALRALVNSTAPATAKVHALWTLNGLDNLTAADVHSGLTDQNPRVREQAIRLSEELKSITPAILAELNKLTKDKDARLRFQLALSLGEFQDQAAIDALVTMIRDPQDSLDIISALMTSAGPHLKPIAEDVLMEQNDDPGLLRFKKIAQMVGAQSDDKLTATVLTSLATAGGRNHLELLNALGAGLRRRGLSVLQFADKLPKDNPTIVALQMISTAQTRTALDEKAPSAARLKAIEFLREIPVDGVIDELGKLLTPTTSTQIQKTAIATLAAYSSNDVPAVLFRAWPKLTPTVRSN
ncbi:MAG: dehydrogenase, partial [Planctomycetaceae bacterium]|nr:dehydrogenase [Planctomycetaceae bacterium]